MSFNDWTSIKLGELIESISIKHDFEKDELIFLNTSDVLEGKVLHHNYSEVAKMPGQAKKSIQKGDILFSEIRPKNKRFAYIDFDAKDFVVSTKLMVLRRKSSLIDNKFLYKLLTSDRMLNYLQHIAEGRSGTFPQITFSELKNIDILLPSIQEQIAIAKTLDDLDEKIEINNKINKKLEEMAQAIFKQWFVDFEFPNEDGKPYKSSGGEMVESELGMIPKGWEVKKLSEVISVKDGTHDSPKAKEDGFSLITSKHIKGNKILYNEAKLISKEDFDKINKRSKVDTNDILITMIGTVGNLIIVNKENVDFAIKNIGLIKTSENEEIFEFVYLYLKSKEMKNYIESRLAGSTQQYISLNELRNIPIILPKKEILTKFKKIIKSIFEQITIDIREESNLIHLRDTLLPKLMSGEIRVPID